MKTKTIIIASMMLLTSCMQTHHIVGNGSQTGVTKKKIQVYVMWGLIPLGEVDSKQMAGGAKDYEITTKKTFLNFLINIPGTFLTIRTQTIEVVK